MLLRALQIRGVPLVVLKISGVKVVRVRPPHSLCLIGFTPLLEIVVHANDDDLLAANVIRNLTRGTRSGCCLDSLRIEGEMHEPGAQHR